MNQRIILLQLTSMVVVDFIVPHSICKFKYFITGECSISNDLIFAKIQQDNTGASVSAANTVCSSQMNGALVQGTVIQFSSMSPWQLYACIGLLLPTI
jgi:hypothetical protein